MISDNVQQVRSSIEQICKKLNRNPQEITLVGVTKFAEVDLINEAVAAGVAHIGENKVQEGKRKFPLIQEAGAKVTKHMIGHLQSNKAKEALQYFDIIESVDSFKLAKEIDKEAAKLGRVADVLMQVNTSGEEQKYGVEKTKAFKLLEEISGLNHIRVLGLMTIAPNTEDKEIIRLCFRDLKELFDSFKKNYAIPGKVEMKYLSMGMSSDYPIALEEGANVVRVGSAIFKGAV